MSKGAGSCRDGYFGMERIATSRVAPCCLEIDRFGLFVVGDGDGSVLSIGRDGSISLPYSILEPQLLISFYLVIWSLF